MSNFIDLSHDFADSMPGFRMKNEDGSYTQYSAKIHPFLTHQQTLPKFKNLCSFEITKMSFQTSIGTYLDAPYHRYPNGRDISQITISELILPGIVVNAKDSQLDLLRIIQNLDITGKAVLFNFGWDKYWGMELYHSYPFISREMIEYIVQQQVKLVGVDTINVDDSRDLTRPAHTILLKNEIFIVENLTQLDRLYKKNISNNEIRTSQEFRFFAVPIKGKKVAAMPIRAFAEIR